VVLDVVAGAERAASFASLEHQHRGVAGRLDGLGELAQVVHVEDVQRRPREDDAGQAAPGLESDGQRTFPAEAREKNVPGTVSLTSP
jgi:hypothetical protein